MEAGWIRAASVDELADDLLGVTVDKTPIALYRVDDQIYATSNICTHAFAFLSDGYLEAGLIECPVHAGRFDVRTGKAMCEPLEEDIRTFAVKEEDGGIFVEIGG